MERIYLIAFSALVFLVYVGYISIVYGVQTSISESYYCLNKKSAILIFCLTFWMFSIPITILAETGLLFFSGTFISLVGASPAFKSHELQRSVHRIGAYGGIIFGMASLIFDYEMWYMVILFIIISINLMFICRNTFIWWVEVAAFLVIEFSLLINYLGL